MSTQLISRNDAQFDLMQKQYITTVAGTPDKFGLVAGDVTGLKAAAYYLLRWQSPRGESGPFGVMIAAKIPL